MHSVNRAAIHALWMQPFCVYRHWDKDGRLLYVGCTNNPHRRWNEHRTDSLQWVFEVVASQVTWYPTRDLALVAEWVAIDTEDPAHNVQSSLKTRAALSRYATPVTPS